MTGKLVLALLLALVSAGALNWGFFRQHEQASTLPPLTLARPLRSLWVLFSNRRWFVGFLVGILGWIFYVAALAFGPLSLVQAASAGGIGVLALLVWRWGGVTLARREWFGVAVSVGGLVLLGVSLLGRGGNAHHWGSHASWIAIALWLGASGLLAAFFAGPGARLVAAGAGFGIGAGFLYAAGDVGTKAAVAGGWRLLFVPALLAAHGLGFALLQLGFQRGSALATAGVATLFTNATPIAAGLALFHEPLPAGPRGALRLLAFAAVVGGAVLLTRSSHEEQPAAAPSCHHRSRARRLVFWSAVVIVAAAATSAGEAGPALRPPPPLPGWTLSGPGTGAAPCGSATSRTDTSPTRARARSTCRPASISDAATRSSISSTACRDRRPRTTQHSTSRTLPTRSSPERTCLSSPSSPSADRARTRLTANGPASGRTT